MEGASARLGDSQPHAEAKRRSRIVTEPSDHSPARRILCLAIFLLNSVEATLVSCRKLATTCRDLQLSAEGPQSASAGRLRRTFEAIGRLDGGGREPGDCRNLSVSEGS